MTANAVAFSPTKIDCDVCSITALATEIALLIRRKHPTAPMSEWAPSMIIASRVTSPSEPGDPPKPTVPSHRSSSQAVHPASTASTAVRPFSSTSNALEVALVHGHVLIARSRLAVLCWGATAETASGSAAQATACMRKISTSKGRSNGRMGRVSRPSANAQRPA